MTFQFRALSDIEADITYRFSIGGVSARHSSTRIRQLWNVGWQELREMVSGLNDGSYLKATNPATFASVSATTAAVTGEVYSEIDWPLSAIGIYGVRVLTSTRWYPLKRIPWAAYQDYQYEAFLESITGSRGPVAYIPRLIPTGVGSTETVGKIMILPVPASGSYRLWYLEAWQALTADTDKFSGHAEFIEWNIHNVLLKMLSPDGNSGDQYAMWKDALARCQDRIETRARRLDSGTSSEPRDARNDGFDPDQWGEFGRS